MKKLCVVSVLLATVATVFAAGDTVITVSNPTADPWPEAPVVVKWQQGMPGKGTKLPLILKSDGGDAPCQVDDLDGDGLVDLVRACSQDGGVQFHRGDGHGGFVELVRVAESGTNSAVGSAGSGVYQSRAESAGSR